MNTHPYLRAFLAGTLVPTLVLPLFLAAFIVVRLVLQVPVPIERGLIFPMAVVTSADPAVSEEIRRKTAMAFGRLPLKLRVAATLAVIEERPYKEVAEAIGISVAAVKLRVFRALRLLRKDLELQGITP